MQDSPLPGANPVPAAKAARKPLRTRVIAAAVLAPLAIAFTWAGDLVFALVCVVVGLLALREWNAVSRHAQDASFFVAVAAVPLTAAASLWLGPAWGLAALLAGAVSCFAVERRTNEAPWLAVGLLYTGSLAVSGPTLRAGEWGLAAVVWLLLVVWASDTFAFFAGRRFKGPKLAPTVSPNKTWSGAVGGLVASMLVGVLFALALGLADPLPLALMGLAISLMAQVGDLLESAFKRRFHVKDASDLIPGHGGMIDRIDGLLVAAILAASVGLARGAGDAAAGLLLW